MLYGILEGVPRSMYVLEICDRVEYSAFVYRVRR
jgi:hypothetical protein